MRGKSRIIKRAFTSILFVVAVLWAPALMAQRTIVSGKVYDAQTKEPLPYVNIGFKDSKIGTITDNDGNYKIETYYSTDSLSASFVGYKMLTKRVNQDHEQVINFALQPSTVQMKELVVHARNSENPAHKILRHIWANKASNNREKLDAYDYEAYNKIEFDVNNFSKDFTDKRLFKKFHFVFNYIDSSGPKVSLPIFMTESLSHFYYRREPKSRKEIIEATKVSGINNQSISQFLGQMYQDVNIYDNSIEVFNKNFISPIADYGLLYYRYYLVDSAFIGNKWCYRLDYKPKNPTELVFSGHFWVNDTTYAIKEMDAELGKQANLNFISHMWVHHEYDEVQPEVWMLKKEQLTVDFNIKDNGTGMYGKKTTTYSDFTINQAKPDSFFAGPNNIIVKTPVNAMDSSFWAKRRMEPLSRSEKDVYQMVDSLKHTPQFMTYVDVVNFIFTGYKVKGPFEYGPVWTFLSWNLIEGYRLKLGGRTSNDFSKRVMLEGYGAYGIDDRLFKYSLGGQWIINKNPRLTIGGHYKRDLELLNEKSLLLPRDHIFTSIFRRNPMDRLTYVKEGQGYLYREWFNGFSSKLQFTHRIMQAKGNWSYLRPSDVFGDPKLINTITTSEISLDVRFAYHEKFVAGEFERISLGSKYPILEVNLDQGLKGFINGDYNYQKLTADIQYQWSLGPLGHWDWHVFGGKAFEPLPYPLLFIHAGNETIFRNSKAFNTMNFFEFVSDEYVRVSTEYHLDGLLFNKIPLMKRLHFRSVVGANVAFGRYNPDNEQQLLLPPKTYTLNNGPYIEGLVGVENILKLFRLDFTWRFSYLDHPNVNRLSILLGYNIQF